MSGFSDSVFALVSLIILIYFLLINASYLLFTVLSLFGIFRYRQLTTFVNFREVFRLPLVKPISIIAPAHNEENTIVESVKALLSLEYPLFEVIVVNDGSSDQTLEKLTMFFDLQKTRRVFRKAVETKPIKGIYVSSLDSRLIVVDKVNGKKADALNAGLNVSKYPLFCAVDSDSLLEKGALLKIVRPFLEDPEKTVAAGGIIRLSNGCLVESGHVVRIKMPANFLARFQIIEYLRAFLGGRIGLSMLKSLLVISGAFGLFRKDIVLQCGGYRAGTVGEDMDLIVRMRKFLHEKKTPFRICFIPDPICWTEAPESMRLLSRQRNRWHRGLIETLLHNRRLFLNPRYGSTGLLAMPFYVVFEMLGPLVELLGYGIFVASLFSKLVNFPFAVMFFFVAIVLGTIHSLMALLLEEYSSHRYPHLRDILIITAFGVMENFLYRQVLTLVRAKAAFDFVAGKKEWGAMRRKGFALGQVN